MSKYSKKFKLSVVEAYLSGVHGQERIAALFHVDRRQIRDWTSAYKAYGHKALNPKDTQRHYSPEFKLSVLSYKRDHSLSQLETAVLFNIPSPSTFVAGKSVIIVRV